MKLLIQPALLATALFLCASCVGHKAYQNAEELAAHYQKQLNEKDLQLAQLQSDNDRLRRQATMSEVTSLSDAGLDGDLDTRLSDLQRKIDGLGRPPQDIERFDVDGGYVLMIQDKILFASGSSDLSPEGKAALAKVADDINAKPHGRIMVRGHTDSDRVVKAATKEKFPHGNIQLSAARSIEVAVELTSSGKVPEKDIVVVGFGPHDPLKPNNSSDNKRLNRRVEIFVADSNIAPDKTPTAASK
jgi:chemotaxis protein MotB